MATRAEYGQGHPDFLAYVKFIVEHPAYEGMPDVYKDDGGIQWEAPSNRSGGKFKDTHHRRRDWWRRKALSIGVDIHGAHWISRAAKQIHPTKRRPCKVCGRIMEIRYAYPSHRLIKRLRKLPYLDERFAVDPLEHIADLIPRLVERYGPRVFRDLPAVLRTKSMRIPDLPEDLARWIRWVEEVYIPAEPSTLSPGAMSNAPDRLDGFHSFNLCCRSKTDPGRSKENLQSYATDRRVFEYWVDGDWIAADRMMGQIRSVPNLQKEDCLHGHPGPCSADHIGPISLGFAHRPEFQLLCQYCNSAKNNRMYLSDVQHLRTVESRGQVVISWYAQDLWDACKNLVETEETALRLSKLLRDNRHTVMHVLNTIADNGHFVYLTMFLGLGFTKRNPSFVNLRVVNHITRYDAIEPGIRTTRYVLEQQARRVRVAFLSLRDYVAKSTRNAYVIMNNTIMDELRSALAALAQCPTAITKLDSELAQILAEPDTSEERLRALVAKLSDAAEDAQCFASAGSSLKKAMALVAKELSCMWTHERYVREAIEDLDSPPL